MRLAPAVVSPVHRQVPCDSVQQRFRSQPTEFNSQEERVASLADRTVQCGKPSLPRVNESSRCTRTPLCSLLHAHAQQPDELHPDKGGHRLSRNSAGSDTLHRRTQRYSGGGTMTRVSLTEAAAFTRPFRPSAALP
jgi:hypothetical protein